MADYYGRVNNVTTTLMIRIDDLDDQDPQFTYNSYTSMVKEGVSSEVLPILPGAIYAEDLDTLNAIVAYSLSGKLKEYLVVGCITQWRIMHFG